MRSLLTALLLLATTLTYAGAGDFLKATINGKPYELKDDNLSVFYEAGGSAFVQHPYYLLSAADPEISQRLQLAFTLPVGTALKAGKYKFPNAFESMTAEPPYAQVHLDEGESATAINWTLDDAAEGEIVITSIKGKVVEGTFRAKLHATDQQDARTVASGTFRFTME